VAAPAGAPLGLIREFVASRRAWIEAKRALLAQAARATVELTDGVRLPHLGESLTLVVDHHPGTRTACRRDGAQLLVSVSTPAALRPAVERWYRRAALAHAAARVAHFAPRVGRAPTKLAVRAQRTRWGSCTSRGAVNLNWRLLQAAPEVFDYVVVHELCHLLVPNHSPRFWREVARVLPDFAERRAALRRFGRQLAF
jgi:hypothetical protein